MSKENKRTLNQKKFSIIFRPTDIPESEREGRINLIYRKMYQWTMEKKLKELENEREKKEH